MSWQAALTLAVPASVAILGFFVAYVVNLRLAQRSDQLRRVSDQLSDLYGPLYALVKATDISWKAFRLLTGQVEHSGTRRIHRAKLTQRLGGSGCRWCSCRSTARCETWSVTQAQLLDQNLVPGCLLELCAHVSTYEAILGQWANEDFSQHVSAVPFPRQELTDYAVGSFGPLKSKQQRLLKSSHKPDQDRPAEPARQNSAGP